MLQRVGHQTDGARRTDTPLGPAASPRRRGDRRTRCCSTTEEFAAFGLMLALYAVLAHKWQNWMLLFASYVFYGAWDWRLSLSILTASALIDYAVGLAIDGTRDRRRQRLFLTVGITANLRHRWIFQVLQLLRRQPSLAPAGSWRASRPARAQPRAPPWHLVLHVSEHELRDRLLSPRRAEGDSQPPVTNFLLFVSFFPHLIAGPIMRATSLLAQVMTPRRITFTGLSEGAFQIFWGLFLKVCMS